MGKLCFSLFFKKKLIFLVFMGFFLCFSTRAHGMRLCRDDRAYAWFTSSNTSLFLKSWATGKAGLQSSAWGKKSGGGKKQNREHTKMRLSHVCRSLNFPSWGAFLSLFFFFHFHFFPLAKVAESASKLVKEKQTKKKTLQQTVMGLYIYKVSLADAAFRIGRVCAHNRRNLTKKNKCGNNTLIT